MKVVYLVIGCLCCNFCKGQPEYEDAAKIADGLISRYSFYIENAQFEKAVKTADTLTYYMQLGKVDTGSSYALFLSSKAACYAKLKRNEEAIRTYEEARKVFQKTNRVDKYYRMLLDTESSFLKVLRQYQKAEAVLLVLIEVDRKMNGDRSENYISSVNRLAVLYHDAGFFEKAEKRYREICDLKKAIFGEISTAYASSINNLGQLYTDNAQFEKAEALLLRSCTIEKQVSGTKSLDYASSLASLGVLYYNTAHYEKAEPINNEALQILRNTDEVSAQQLASLLANQAIIYQMIGQYEKAEQLYLEAKKQYRELLETDDITYIMIISSLSELYKQLGRFESAVSLLMEANELLKKGDRPDALYSANLNRLGLMYIDAQQYNKAELLLMEAYEIDSLRGDNGAIELVFTLNNLGFLYKLTERYAAAEQFLIKAKELSKKLTGEVNPTYIEILLTLSKTYQSNNEYKKAEALLISAKQNTIKFIGSAFSALSEKEKNEYMARFFHLNEECNSFLFMYRKADPLIYRENYNLQLSFKSLVLAETKTILESLRKTSDTTVKKKIKEWQTYKTVLSKQYVLPLAQRRPDLAALEGQKESVEKELNRLSADFRSRQNTETGLIDDIRKKLGDDEVAIEFVRFNVYAKKWTNDVMYAAYILYKNDPVPAFVLLFEEEELTKLFDSTGNTAVKMVEQFYRGLIGENSGGSMSVKLFDMIWKPLEPYLTGIKKIGYAPVGKLYRIAFNALVIDSTRLLSDKYQLQQFTSTRQIALRDLNKKNNLPANVVLFGDAKIFHG